MASNILRIQKRLRLMVLMGIILLLTPACAPTYHDYAAFLPEERPLVTATEYRVKPPDVVAVDSKRVREINGQVQQLRPDGVITLPLLGDVFVAGRTTDEIAAELAERSREFYQDADVTVRVAQFNSKKIFVFGEVGRPGPQSYHGANRVLDTLAIAQPSRLADPTRITVLRPDTDGELIRRMTIDLDAMVKRGDVTLDAVLEEGDIIYVPANPLARVGLAFQQLLLPIQPAASTFQGATSIDQNVTNHSYGR